MWGTPFVETAPVCTTISRCIEPGTGGPGCGGPKAAVHWSKAGVVVQSDHGWNISSGFFSCQKRLILSFVFRNWGP